MPIKTIIAAVGKSDPAFDLQTDISFGGNGRANINKFLNHLVPEKKINDFITRLDFNVFILLNWRDHRKTIKKSKHIKIKKKTFFFRFFSKLNSFYE